MPVRESSNLISLPNSPLVHKIQKTPYPPTINFELTARCNNNCPHCYINLPADDPSAQAQELSFPEISAIADQAIDNGVLWCLLTGGEPLLRKDFLDIYIALKKKGLLVSVFTNGCLLTREHVEVFKKYVPRMLEVTVYGVTPSTYERVTGIKGSYQQFRAGLDLLFANQVPVSLKAMAIRSNVHEIGEIAAFCEKYSRKQFRFDPFLHQRYDGNEARNKLIRAQRLSVEEILALEQGNPARRQALIENCGKLIGENDIPATDALFWCGILKNGFEVSYDGHVRLCAALRHPAYTRDLRSMALMDAYREIADTIQTARSDNTGYLNSCNRCNIINLCQTCPAHCYLETGKLDVQVEHFCSIARAREAALKQWQADEPPHRQQQ